MEHNSLTLDYWKDQVCYEGTLLPSGTLGCDALNLPEDLLQSLTVFSLPLNQLLLFSHPGAAGAKAAGCCRNRYFANAPASQKGSALFLFSAAGV